ncbi:hypothetical protein DFH09DRAFT_1328112 [Mycena vulgaris]|nr:hypothetical protein DFH09DRAFT_1328112 [Mycena vulgaris]
MCRRHCNQRGPCDLVSHEKIRLEKLSTQATSPTPARALPPLSFNDFPPFSSFEAIRQDALAPIRALQEYTAAEHRRVEEQSRRFALALEGLSSPSPETENVNVWSEHEAREDAELKRAIKLSLDPGEQVRSYRPQRSTPYPHLRALSDSPELPEHVLAAYPVRAHPNLYGTQSVSRALVPDVSAEPRRRPTPVPRRITVSDSDVEVVSPPRRRPRLAIDTSTGAIASSSKRKRKVSAVEDASDDDIVVVDYRPAASPTFSPPPLSYSHSPITSLSSLSTPTSSFMPPWHESAMMHLVLSSSHWPLPSRPFFSLQHPRYTNCGFIFQSIDTFIFRRISPLKPNLQAPFKTEDSNLGIAGDARTIPHNDQSSDELPFGNELLFDVEPDFDEEESLDLDYILRPLTPDTPIMANAAPQQAPAGTGVASFRVPRPWESNVPKFTTEDKDDLQDFIEQVTDIINLAQITDEQEKKQLLTSYLPAKKREMWRALTEYAVGTTYANFKKAVLKAYPEVKEDLDGTLEELVKLCAENRTIKRSEEGRLKRFGM